MGVDDSAVDIRRLGQITVELNHWPVGELDVGLDGIGSSDFADVVTGSRLDVGKGVTCRDILTIDRALGNGGVQRDRHGVVCVNGRLGNSEQPSVCEIVNGRFLSIKQNLSR